MAFHQFYCYWALLFALGLIEVAAITPYEVTAITNGNFFGGPGCFVYYPHLHEFEFIPKIYRQYADIKRTLQLAGNNRDLLREDGHHRDMLQHANYLIGLSRQILHLYSKHECQEYYEKQKILSHSFSIADRSLRFKYHLFTGEVKDVEITFSENAGLEAIRRILSTSD